jgi:hypothetical protein
MPAARTFGLAVRFSQTLAVSRWSSSILGLGAWRRAVAAGSGARGQAKGRGEDGGSGDATGDVVPRVLRRGCHSYWPSWGSLILTVADWAFAKKPLSWNFTNTGDVE